MTFRTILLSLLAYGLILVGLATLHGDLLGLAVPLVVYLILGLFRSPEKVDLQVHRELSQQRVTPETPVEISLTITNRGPALEEIRVEDPLPHGLNLLDGDTRHLLTLPAGDSVSWKYTVSGPRGYYPFETVLVEAGEHLGLIQIEKNFPAPGQLSVLPPLTRLKRAAIRPRRTRVYSGTIPARTGGPGVEFFGVREYQTGDSPRWINWRVSARHTEALFSNEFEQERVADVGLILDERLRTNQVGTDGSLLEYSVMAAAALADSFITQGNRVSLLQCGQYLQWTLPGYGKIQRERLMQDMAHAKLGDSLVFSYLGSIPTQMFPPYSQVILISPLAADDLETLIKLRSRGYQVLIISPDPVAFELSVLPKDADVELAARIVRMERKLLLHKLRRAGMQVINWDVSLPFDQVIQSRLLRPLPWVRTIGS
jgi:uncharacterized protein (DUF58 family)